MLSLVLQVLCKSYIADCKRFSPSDVVATKQCYAADVDHPLLVCASVQKYRYERLQELGSGSYAIVYKARNRETDEVIALKKLRFGFDEQGLPSSTLREISLLKELKHANIVE